MSALRERVSFGDRRQFLFELREDFRRYSYTGFMRKGNQLKIDRMRRKSFVWNTNLDFVDQEKRQSYHGDRKGNQHQYVNGHIDQNIQLRNQLLGFYEHGTGIT